LLDNWTYFAGLFGHLLAAKYVMTGKRAPRKKYHRRGEYKDPVEKILWGPMAPHITLAVKKTFPPGQVYEPGWSGVQILEIVRLGGDVVGK
jgi:hypothetical protein